MHDLYLAKEILETSLNFAKKNNCSKIKTIKIKLGNIDTIHNHKHDNQDNSCHGEINPENLKFNFKLISKKTIAENAELEIIKIKENGWQLEEIEC